MPTISVNVKATKQDEERLYLELEYEGRTVEMTVRPDMTILEMAQMAVNQPFPELPDVKFDGVANITFHTETYVDEEGNETTYRVVDSVERGE